MGNILVIRGSSILIVISNIFITTNVSFLSFPSKFAKSKKKKYEKEILETFCKVQVNTKSKKKEYEKEILETFCKVQVNTPLLDAIKQ
jgi:hypothetical protein